MEVKVWVEGIQRVVCGVSEKTTCQDVVFALAHATGRVGRFTLVEKWRDNERLLAPSECPLQVLHKWGEYSNDVQFILRHSDEKKRQSGRRKKERDKSELSQRAPPAVSLYEGKAPTTAIKKSLTFSGVHARSNSDLKPGLKIHHAQQSSLPNGYIPEFSPPPGGHTGNYQANGLPPDPVRNGLPPNHQVPKNQMEYTSPLRTSLANDIVPVLHNQKPKGSALPNGSSPPRLNGHVPQMANSTSGKHNVNSRVLTNGGPPSYHGGPLANGSVNHHQREAQEHEELMRKITQQSNRLKDQEARLRELDAGLKVLPNLEQESELELQAVLRKLEECELSFDEEIQELELVSWTDKLDLEQKQETSLRAELRTLQENLGKLESELKLRSAQADKMSSDLQSESERFKRKQCELKASMDSEISVLTQELRELDCKKSELDSSLSAAEKESAQSSTALVEREMVIADLEKDLLQVNMDNFSKVPSILTVEGEKPFTKQRPGSARRLTSSPQHLADKVATASNPQGLWV